MKNSLFLLFLNRFFYAILIPIILVFALCSSWIEMRREILSDQIRQQQQDRIHGIEEFYSQEFEPTIQREFLKVMGTLDPGPFPTEQNWNRIYNHQFFPHLAYPPVKNLKEERASPFRLLYAAFQWREGLSPLNLQEVIFRSINPVLRLNFDVQENSSFQKPAHDIEEFHTWLTELSRFMKDRNLKFDSLPLNTLMDRDRYLLRNHKISAEALNKEDDWFLFSTIVEKLNRITLIGDESSKAGELFQADSTAILPLYGGPVKPALQGGLYEVASRGFTYQVYPIHHEVQTYLQNSAPPPSGVLYGMINKVRLPQHFLEILNSFLRFKESQQSSSEAVQRFLLKRGIEPENTANPIKNLLAAVHTLSQHHREPGVPSYWSASLSYLLGIEGPWIRYRNHQWNTHSKLQFHKPGVPLKTLGSTDLNPFDYEQFHLSRNNRLAFKTQRQSTEFEATLFRSNQFPNTLFLLTLDSDSAYEELTLIQIRGWLTLLFTLGLITLCGTLLNQRIPLALSRLNSEVQAFSSSVFTGRQESQTFKAPLNTTLEIEDLRMSFQRMGSQVRERIFEISSLNEINQELVDGAQMDTLLQLGCDRIANLLGSQLCALVVFEAFSAERILHSQIYDRHSRSAEDMEKIIQVLTDQAPSVMDPQPLDHQDFASLSLNQPFLLPLISKDRETGSTASSIELQGILLIDPYSPDEFSVKQRNILSSFTSQLRTVLNKAHLEKIREDNVLGSQIQMDLMPSSAPQLPGMEISSLFLPANFLGGDFLDFLDFPGERSIGMVVSDVSGKGIGPALLGASCKAYLQSKKLERCPGKILAEVNQLLCPRTSPGLFATAFLGIVNLEDSTLKYAAAGHNLMLHYQSSKSRLVHLDTEDFPLGMSLEFTYSSHETQFHEGDWLILYTDGLVDLVSPSGEAFGTPRLEALILSSVQCGPEALAERIKKELNQHCRGALPCDDVTFILLKGTAPA
ncbi:SpoIIE family protein phosphatase [bacterium]|jgi:serine phosphatase RsbU (regulator of sigma subunit)|nr:SpoIIE family protein phosphatase [bacterium]